MTTLRPILCPVDFSEQSRQALLWAAAIAQRRGAGLTVLSVVDPLLARSAEIRLSVDVPRDDAMPALREFVENAVAEPVRQQVRIRLEVAVGATAEAILSVARTQDAGLLVMGTHGRGGLSKLLLGSTTEAVLRQTEWPVLAVPGGAVDAPSPENPGARLRLIVTATDFSESATAATLWAADLASDVNVPLVVAHVVEPVAALESFQPLSADLESERVTSAQRRVAELSATLHDTKSEAVVSVGGAAEAIASLALERKASLVVLGLASSGDAAHGRPGSVAYHVLRVAHVAVVVVPAVAKQPHAG
jgi:nucleotide-binding universal stress UspA family protein